MNLPLRFFFIGLLILIILGFLVYIIPIIYQWLFGVIALNMFLNFLKYIIKPKGKEVKKKESFADFIKSFKDKK